MGMLPVEGVDLGVLEGDRVEEVGGRSLGGSEENRILGWGWSTSRWGRVGWDGRYSLRGDGGFDWSGDSVDIWGKVLSRLYVNKN